MQPLRSANIEITEKCNLNCSFCYFSKQKKGRRPNPLNNKQLMKVIDIISTLPRMKEFRLAYIGGEPMMNQDLVGFCQYASKRLSSPEIITNGTLATKEKLEEIKPYISGLQVSLDAPYPGLHDFLRGNVPGAWEKAINCLQWSIILGIPRVITFTISKNNLSYLKDMINLSYKLKAELKILHCIPYSKKQMIQTITPKQNEYLCKMIQKHSLISDTPLQSIISNKQSICDSGINRLCVRIIGGKVSPCDFIPDTFGSILKTNIGTIMQRMADWRDERYLKNKKACRGCRNFQNCYSGCVANQLVYKGYRDRGCWL